MSDKKKSGNEALVHCFNDAAPESSLFADCGVAPLSNDVGLKILKRSYAEGIASGGPRELDAAALLVAYKERFRVRGFTVI